ncbi:SDR family oxidoreductase [Streptomyces globisporus]|uniref:SDR family oxidoreductase n=1 Tax=Streptomyces globisporus TaxID=1908 RepID=UPI00386E20ED|nr:SDR family oxidoreductase [Streptomyces globisporus]
MSGIDGKVVALTGASSGIGRATALLLAERGAKVVLGARRTDRLDALVETIRSRGGTAVSVRTDVTRREDLVELTGLAVSTFGRLDVLVNNAGISKIGPVQDLDVAAWDAMIDVNLRGVLHGTAAALPVFRSQGHGHMVTIISTAGIKIVPTMAVYAATKNAVRTFLEGLRQESTEGWLRLTSVSPGYVQTELADSIDDPEVRREVQANAAKFAITPDALARAVAFAVEEPGDVEVGDIVVRPTLQN